jgi:RNA polymerase sigma-70 factor, ECF subfamily
MRSALRGFLLFARLHFYKLSFHNSPAPSIRFEQLNQISTQVRIKYGIAVLSCRARIGKKEAMVTLTKERVNELLIRCKSRQPQEEVAAWDELARYILTIARQIARIQARSVGLSYEIHGEDIFMGCWISLQTNIGKIKDLDHLRGWLHTTIRHRMIDMKRKARMRLEEPSETLIETFCDDPEAKDPQLYAAVRNLPPVMRDCVFAYYWQDLPIREIAARSGTPESTIKTRLLYARIRLAEALPGY